MEQGMDPLADGGNYEWEKVGDLGKGGLGFVQLCKSANQQQVAIKFTRRGQQVANMRTYMIREIANHRRLGQHPLVAQLLSVFLTKQFLAMVMEYVPGVNLYKLLAQQGPPSEAEARRLFQQVIVGIDYCHRQGVTSRDIKLDNILLDTSQSPPGIKLCDWGFSKHTQNESKAKSKVGTCAYRAPEQVALHRFGTLDPVTRQYYHDAKKSDLWSAGVSLYTLVASKYPFGPFTDEEQHDVEQNIMAGNYQRPPVSDACAHLISRLLTLQPSERITMEEIYQDPWFQTDLPPGLTELAGRPPGNTTFDQAALSHIVDIATMEQMVDFGQLIGDVLGEEEQHM